MFEFCNLCHHIGTCHANAIIVTNCLLQDIDHLRDNLPNLVNDVYITDWDHADFLTATNLPSKLVRLIIDILMNVQ